MSTQGIIRRIARGLAAGSLLTLATAAPMKVFILAGQSNMQGKASESVLLNGLKDDRETQSLHDLLVDAEGKPRVFEKVHVAAVTTGPKTKTGPLTLGFGNDLTARRGLRWGPELAFGATMGEAFDQPILIIKTAWGGKSLHADFLSPSGTAVREGTEVGPYYKLMCEHVKTVLADPGEYHPGYKPSDGFELAGFVWFQGWNDMVDKSIYPEGKEDRYELYSKLLAHFIRDVRDEFGAAEMPFVIGQMGVGGEDFRAAMAKPTELPEFAGNVMAVNTAELRDQKLVELVDRGWRWQRPKWDPENRYAELREKLKPLQAELKEAQKIEDRSERKAQVQAIQDRIESTKYSPEEIEYLKNNQSSQGFHYDGSPKFFARAGEAFAKALIEAEK